MRFQSWTPHGSAASVVAGVYRFDGGDACAEGLIVPDGHLEIGLVVRGTLEEHTTDGWLPYPSCFVDPVQVAAARVRVSSGTVLIAAKLRCGAGMDVLRCTATSLGRRADLVDVVGSAADPVLARVSGGAEIGEIRRAFEALLQRLATRAGRIDAVVETAAARLTRPGATLPRLDRELGRSWRSIEQRFERVLGMSPKRLARIRRIRRAIAGVGRLGQTWAACAADAGFYDQSHLVREFRAITGQTPGAFLARPQFVADLLPRA